jgi:hypothetical protein
MSMKIETILAVVLVVGAGVAMQPAAVRAQGPAGTGTSQTPDSRTSPAASNATATKHEHEHLTYVRPSEKTKLTNYFFDGYGPYPIVGAAIVAGINQADGTPPEWGGGGTAFAKRWGSNYGINAVTTTSRYALSEVLHEDTLYYRCQCKGFFPRLGHALISTLIARHGDDGRYTFSVPDLVSPYVGTMTAAYAWYPGRFSYKDGFRMGNYNLLALAGGNVAIEFLYHGPHTFLSHIYLNNRHAAPESDH